MNPLPVDRHPLTVVVDPVAGDGEKDAFVHDEPSELTHAAGRLPRMVEVTEPTTTALVPGPARGKRPLGTELRTGVQRLRGFPGRPIGAVPPDGLGARLPDDVVAVPKPPGSRGNQWPDDRCRPWLHVRALSHAWPGSRRRDRCARTCAGNCRLTPAGARRRDRCARTCAGNCRRSRPGVRLIARGDIPRPGNGLAADPPKIGRAYRLGGPGSPPVQGQTGKSSRPVAGRGLRSAP